MAFDNADYRRASARLDVPAEHIMAMAAVESSGETIWNVGGRLLPPVRFEAHWFGKLTGYRFNSSAPDLSSYTWRPELAATTRAGAWQQVERARALDVDAANCATSWGAFQVMGFHWHRLGYASVQAFVDSMTVNGDDGQMDAFVAFVEADRDLHRALKAGDFDTVETIFNGGGQGGLYAGRLRDWLATHAAADGQIVPRVLVAGMTGPDVTAMQAALGVLPDGSFGPLTAAAVRAFQAAHGLVIDGQVGAMTRRALGI